MLIDLVSAISSLLFLHVYTVVLNLFDTVERYGINVFRLVT